MNRRIFLQLSGPAAVIGVLLLAASLASAWSIHRLQKNLTTILAENVTSLEAAQELEINLRQLRFHSLMQVMDPKPERQTLIEDDHKGFEAALSIAKENASLAREWEVVQAIEAGYFRYRNELNESQPLPTGKLTEFIAWADKHPVRHLQKPCQELLLMNKVSMETTARESEEVGRQTRIAVLILGILGPISGLIVGYGVSRAWSRSIARLSVRLQDMHAHLDKDVGELKLEFGKDWATIDRQLDRVVIRVKEAAEQLQRHQQEILRAEQLAAVGQLAASVAHEIRNPLTAIKMLVGLGLRRQPLQALTDQDLEVIYEEVGKLEQTVQSLLDYAKPPKIHQREVDLKHVLAQAVNLVRPKAHQQQVQVKVCVPAIAVSSWIDPGQIGNVFVNLLMNSLDAMPQGGEIEVTLDDPGTGMIVVTVSDNGPGISPEMISKLFNPFASGKPTGTGLGLSICQRIVRDHGGTIEFEPCPEGGARFTVTLPKSSPEVADAALVDR